MQLKECNVIDIYFCFSVFLPFGNLLCYILKNENMFKNEQRNRDDAAKE